MTGIPELYWLPPVRDWRASLCEVADAAQDGIWNAAVALANSRLDFVQTNALDAVVRRSLDGTAPGDAVARPVRLAILGSSTFAHLHAGIRVAGLRRGMPVATYENDFGQYWQELHDPASALYRFAPTAVLFAFDARHVTAAIGTAVTAADAAARLENLCSWVVACWRRARDAFRCPILQQTVLPVSPAVLGGNEHVLPGSRARFIDLVNARLRKLAASEAVDILPLDAWSAQAGLARWHDPALWHRSKQEVVPTAGPMYGDLVGRWLAACQGRSAKCLVLDLDNTIWGGAVGEEGVEGIVLGQGSPLGEGFLAVQDYARELARRGVILAVCSKNDEANAFDAFDRHPEMILRRADIACFAANWSDKPSNIRAIAEALNIGLDALVFVDDDPFERALVRRELPMVAVPEAPDEPALVPCCLADAGYFESLAVTDEDRTRTGQYAGNREREALRVASGDIASYLRSLDMELRWRRFDALGLPRIVQLINKTNQFNLTARRYSEAEVRAVIADPGAFGIQLRLLDCFGDNGVIAIVIGRMQNADDLYIDTWLMSCRVLGRQVEQATLALVADQARRLGARRLIGEYRAAPRNGMVRNHYATLGFAAPAPDGATVGLSLRTLDLADFATPDTFIRLISEQPGSPT